MEGSFSAGKTYIIAEIGTAHGGDISAAAALVESAARCGADCAKFQLVYADEILHPATGTVPLPGGDIPLYERFKQLERDADFYAELKRRCEQQGIDFLCTPFGTKSTAILADLAVSRIKIASPELNHIPLLHAVGRTGIPVIISTGVSLLADIETAVRLFMNEYAYPPEKISLLHCITAYPAPEEEYNLRLISNLKNMFGLRTGVSDHSLHPFLVPALSMAAGGSIIEKHFTANRSGGGLDDPIALDPQGFSRMVETVRSVEDMKAEEALEAVGALVRKEEGEDPAARIDAVLGSGVKRLAVSEAGNYRGTRRSVLARTELAAGTVLTTENTGIYRSEKHLKPGLEPAYYSLILGRALCRNVPAGNGIQWEDLLKSPL
jgi:N-acetylneuraminate synthase